MDPGHASIIRFFFFDHNFVLGDWSDDGCCSKKLAVPEPAAENIIELLSFPDRNRVKFSDDIVYFDRLNCGVTQIARMACALMDHPEIELMLMKILKKS